MATVPAQDGIWNGQRVGVGRRTWLKAAAALAVGAAGAWGFWGGEPVAETGAVGAALSHVAETSDKVRGQEAIELCRKYFSDARANLSQIATLSAVFQKQERINDKLQPLNVMDLKVRKTPLSIYMQWQVPDAGQQVLWLDGAHDGKMVVSPAGWKRKLMPMVKIAPDDDMAKSKVTGNKWFLPLFYEGGRYIEGDQKTCPTCKTCAPADLRGMPRNPAQTANGADRAHG